MIKGGADWETNIANAIKEVDQSGNQSSSGYLLPVWIPYLACLVFGMLLADLFINNRATHPINEARDYGTGGKVALLMVAEDVQSYWDSYGKLPDEAPSSIAQVLNISYEKLANDRFKLWMQNGDETIELSASEDTVDLH